MLVSLTGGQSERQIDIQTEGQTEVQTEVQTGSQTVDHARVSRLVIVVRSVWVSVWRVTLDIR